MWLKGACIAFGLMATVFGAGWIIGLIANRIIRENDLKLSGLKGGGRLIGWLERALIFLLFMINQPEGIGFLVAAKSILRYEESKQVAIGEYVLIGTLLSFTLALFFSYLTQRVLTLC